MNSRREFLERVALSTTGLALGGALAPGLATGAPTPMAQGDWDLTWRERVTGRKRAVMDAPTLEDGLGVFRSVVWRRQQSAVFGIPEQDISVVLVIRHNAIPLAMRQDFWDRYDIGTEKGVKTPLSQEPTTRNPALDAWNGQPAPAQFSSMTLPAFMASGGIVLACNLAFQDCVDRVARVDGLAAGPARERAVSMLLPGIILQPSGVFAVTVAQEAGCHYVLASS